MTPLLTRRQAALALLASAASLSGCEKPEEEIVPYVEQPASVTPGVPMRFATSVALNGYGIGVLATCFEGRPVKLEGNPAHPASLGGTDPFTEAAILSLYDPDRSRAVRMDGRIASWEGFLAAMQPRLRALQEGGGKGLRLLTGKLTSPTLLRLIQALQAKYPAMHWHQHEPIGVENALAGSALAFGRELVSLPHLERASVILALDADPLGPGPDQIRNARAFASNRTARRDGTRFSRWYVAEPILTSSGAKADHRIAIHPGAVRDLAATLAARLGAGISAPKLDAASARFIEAVAADLEQQTGKGLVLTGEWQDPEVHALVHWVNQRIAAPVDYIDPVSAAEPLAALRDELRDKRVDTLLVFGVNPAYDAPAALDFEGALRASSAFTVHLGPYHDETAASCRWHLPETHMLEDWGDLRATDGTVSITQPLIRPLHETRSVAWLTGVLLGRNDATAYDAVRTTWTAVRGESGFEPWWRRALHDGVLAGSAAAPVTPAAPRLPELRQAASPSSLTLLFRPDAAAWDGRFANNAWLQECPRPLTRQVWGNAAEIAPEEAHRRRLEDGMVVGLTLAGRHIEASLMVVPGTAPGIVVLTLGYGRRRAGAIGDQLGADAYALRRPEALWAAPGLVLEPTDRRAEVLRARAAHRIEGDDRELFHSMPLDAFTRAPAAKEENPPSLNPDFETDTYAWAMVIDTTLCIGCNACVIACQSENNIPVVGPEQVAVGRDMHWMRIDTYDLGTESHPEPGFQPLPCMHCEHAPCEPVCPVAASVHDSEGLNLQVYNRCIGTRFCEANCPYKVRHFNFFGYAEGEEYANLGDKLITAQRNPEVTVRARGVMEKCTYCVQRISAARRTAEKERRSIAEGEVVTACQAACPSRAIAFGDLHRPGSGVSRLREESSHYALLENLGTRPRTTHLALVRNRNPALDRDPT